MVYVSGFQRNFWLPLAQSTAAIQMRLMAKHALNRLRQRKQKSKPTCEAANISFTEPVGFIITQFPGPMSKGSNLITEIFVH